MTITGDDVKAARGKMSRAAFAELTGLTQGKIANIEKGRKIKPDELALLTPHVQPQLASGGMAPEPSQVQLHPGEVIVPLGQIGEITGEGEVINFEVDDQDDDEENPEEDSEPHSEVDVPSPEPPPAPVIQLRPSSENARLFSNSELATWKRCRRKWYLSWFRRLRPLVEDTIGVRSIGTRVHKALAAWYVADGEEPVDPRVALETAIAEDLASIKQDFAPNEPDIDTLDRFNKECELSRAMVEGYVEWLEETGADQGIQVVASETYVEVDISDHLPFEHEVPVKIIGKMDTRAKRTIDGAKLFIDHKTVGDFTKPVRVLHMNTQMKHYHLLEVMSSTPEERTIGALYNMMRRVKRTARANPPFYARAEVKHNDAELVAFLDQLVGAITDILNVERQLTQGVSHHRVVYPTPKDDCAWDCDFFLACPMFDDGSRVEAYLAGNFTAGNPLAHYDTALNR